MRNLQNIAQNYLFTEKYYVDIEGSIGIIDLGSNSARLVIVNLFADGYFMVVDELKESVRLGQDMERDGFLKPCNLHNKTNISAAFLQNLTIL